MSSYELPPRTTNAEGAMRRVGIEIEFGGITGTEAAEAIRDAVGGSLEKATAHRHMIVGTPLGDLTIELDTRFVHAADPEHESELALAARQALGDVVQVVVPHELITEPVPVDRLSGLDPIVTALRNAGAIGTATNPFHAFGLHLNPEAASREPDYLLNILRAFVLLNGHLREQVRPDATRRLLAWASAYDETYTHKILVPDYQPPLKDLITDYVAANSGRNYDLDMLPIFAELDGASMERLLGEAPPASRPAFHYRLPDCRIDQQDWSVADDWNRWVAVERLADDPQQMLEMTVDYLAGDRLLDVPKASNDN